MEVCFFSQTQKEVTLVFANLAAGTPASVATAPVASSIAAIAAVATRGTSLAVVVATESGRGVLKICTRGNKKVFIIFHSTL